MAKKSKEEIAEEKKELAEEQGQSEKKRIASSFAFLDKINPDADFLANSSLSVVDGWIDTGCMALNAIISGTLYGGIPKGRVTVIAGPTQSGKSYILNRIIANAQRQDMEAAMWDTEFAESRKTAAAMGCDLMRIKHLPILTVEDCRNQITKFLDRLIANNLRGKFMIGVDSVGNLSSAKEMADIASDKDSADMGLRAKALKSFMRAITYKAAKANVPIVLINHTYDSPAEMFPSIIKKQGGGSGPMYIASVVVQLFMTLDKLKDNPDDAVVAGGKDVTGVTLRAMTAKNRYVTPFLETDLHLNFKTGFKKYSGLVTMMKEFGLLEANGPTWKFQGKSIGPASKWAADKEMWEKTFLPVIEERVKKEFVYSKDDAAKAEEPTDDPIEEPAAEG